MADIKTRVQSIDPNLCARDVAGMAKPTGNIYVTIAAIAERARALNVAIKEELHGKLEEFAVISDRIEEIQENKEQIEISKFYEKLPNPTIIATNEYLANQLDIQFKDGSEADEDVF